MEKINDTYPPRNAPTGVLIGNAPAATLSFFADVWNERVAIGLVTRDRKIVRERSCEAIFEDF